MNQAGFGCAGLMGALSRRESRALLETAWEAGVRHYDAAPMYGHGETERVLGEFLKGRRDQVTLVTKFGIEPGGHSPLKEFARSMARPLVRALPGLHRSRGPARAESQTADPSPRPPITGEAAERSLERSLRALQTDYIDILLVHEPRTELLTDDTLVGVLEAAVRKGSIRAFGVGGDRRALTAVAQSHPALCPVVQCEWSLLHAPPPSFPGRSLIVFGILSGLPRDRDYAAQARVALRAAALSLPESVILFSSRKSAHVTDSVKALSDSTLDSAAREMLASGKF